MTPCPSCNGVGTKPRERRKLVDGTADPLDILGQFPTLCDACGGSGSMPEKQARAAAISAAKRAADISG
jgi:DnaJ-class molecular chaperone